MFGNNIITAAGIASFILTALWFGVKLLIQQYFKLKKENEILQGEVQSNFWSEKFQTLMTNVAEMKKDFSEMKEKVFDTVFNAGQTEKDIERINTEIKEIKLAKKEQDSRIEKIQQDVAKLEANKCSHHKALS